MLRSNINLVGIGCQVSIHILKQQEPDRLILRKYSSASSSHLFMSNVMSTWCSSRPAKLITWLSLFRLPWWKTSLQVISISWSSSFISFAKLELGGGGDFLLAYMLALINSLYCWQHPSNLLRLSFNSRKLFWKSVRRSSFYWVGL